MPRGVVRCTVIPMVDREALRREAVRIQQRYAIEIVEGLGFCPWAAAARLRGRVQVRVLFGAEPGLDDTLREATSLESDSQTDIGLLVFPEATLERIAFQHFAARVRERYAPQGERRARAFAIADFHPAATLDLSDAARLVPFIRKSPDPTLQLVRETVLQAARRGEPQGTRFVDPAQLAAAAALDVPDGPEPLHERMARANLQTVKRLGPEQVEALLAEIARDRDLSYGRLGLPLPAWSARATCVSSK